MTNRQRIVLIRMGVQGLINEVMPGQIADDIDHAQIGNAGFLQGKRKVTPFPRSCAGGSG